MDCRLDEPARSESRRFRLLAHTAATLRSAAARRMTASPWVWLTQHLIPKNLSSAIVYRATRSRRAWLKRPLTRWFAQAYGVDLTEAANADLESYATFNEFFTRELKVGARPIASGPYIAVAPSDGVLTEHGAIEGGRVYQAKGSA